jgi:hypothetical protein
MLARTSPRRNNWQDIPMSRPQRVTIGVGSFSDATNPDQQVLFTEATTDGLANDLSSHFVGEPKMQVVSVEGYVHDDTAYLRRHMVDALKILEGKDEITVDAIKADGKRRVARTYPNTAFIRFTDAISRP